MPTLLWTPVHPLTHTWASASKINAFPRLPRLQLWVKFSPGTLVGGVTEHSPPHHASESLVFNLELVGGDKEKKPGGRTKSPPLL